MLVIACTIVEETLGIISADLIQRLIGKNRRAVKLFNRRIYLKIWFLTNKFKSTNTCDISKEKKITEFFRQMTTIR